MADKPDSATPEWRKLKPAIAQGKTVVSADELLVARRAQKVTGQNGRQSVSFEVEQDRVEQDELKNKADSSAFSEAPTTAAHVDLPANPSERVEPSISHSTKEFSTGDQPASKTPPVAVLPTTAPENIGVNKPESQSQQAATQRSSAREQAVKDEPRWLKLRKLVLILAVPLTIYALAVRAVATPLFLWAVYHRPGFPADSYGFSTEQRMTYGSYGMDYILNFAPAAYLGDLRQGSAPMFLESEVQHMTDVKIVMLFAMAFALLVLLLALLSSRTLRYRAPGTLRKSIFTGSWLTLGLTLILGVVAALGWETFFTNFHHLFFPQGNWEFRMDDTLIRLYPPQFWVDAGITVLALIMLVSVVAISFTWPTKNRRARAQRLLQDRMSMQEKLIKP